MNRFGQAVFVGILFQSACGVDSTIEKEGFIFEKSLTNNQIELTEYDLKKVKTLKFLPPDEAQFQEVFGTSSEHFQGYEWIRDRLSKVIPGEEKKLQKNRLREYRSGVKSFTSELPVVDTEEGCEKEEPSATSTENQITLAMNLGGSIFYDAKKNASIYEARVGSKWYPIDSPRVGLVALFDTIFFSPEQKDILKDDFMVFARLHTLFHEARHSDGNGASQSFFHAACPKDHDYPCEVLCDRSKNGSYSVGYVVLKSLLQQCANCSSHGRALLEAMAADTSSRILPDAEIFDEEPEYVH